VVHIHRQRRLPTRETFFYENGGDFMSYIDRDNRKLNSAPAELVGNFTDAEKMELNILKSDFHLRPEVMERELSDRRLEFARWLVEHGRLSEGEASA